MEQVANQNHVVRVRVAPCPGFGALKDAVKPLQYSVRYSVLEPSENLLFHFPKGACHRSDLLDSGPQGCGEPSVEVLSGGVRRLPEEVLESETESVCFCGSSISLVGKDRLQPVRLSFGQVFGVFEHDIFNPFSLGILANL